MLKKLGTLALIFSAALVPATAFAQNRYRNDNHYYSRDHRYDGRDRRYEDHWRHERRDHEWREHERAERYYRRGYYAPNYYAPNHYYSPAPSALTVIRPIR